VKEKFQFVDVDGKSYRIGRFSPQLGSFILMQIIGAGIKGQAPAAPVTDAPSTEPAEKLKPEEIVRAMVFGAFLKGMDYTAHQFIMQKCLSVCSVMGGPEEKKVPIPLMNDNLMMLPEIQDDLALIMKLQMEVLCFNFTDFFVAGGLNSLGGIQPSKG
jgi:hypothetical protein